MRINSPYITGSAIITGNLCVQGTILGTITGVASTASYAETLDGLDSTQFVQTGSFNSYTSSASSSIGSLSGSVATTTSGLSSSIGSLSSSVATTTSGLSSSVATTTSGLGGRITTIEGNYATTGSNTFVGSQVITGSLYITNDMIVQGCSCLQNITASAVSIGTNTVVLNTATPAVRFAGVSVQDSGSNAGVTGSIFWDGLCNRWVYSNPSGIGYSGGMLLSGPRTSTLGTESPLTCNYIAKSGGGDHLYDSCIYESGSRVGINTSTLSKKLHICGTGSEITFDVDSANLAVIRGNVTTNFDLNNEGFGGCIRLYGSAIQFRTNVADPAVVINNGGCMGINCTAPTGILTVGGDNNQIHVRGGYYASIYGYSGTQQVFGLYGNCNATYLNARGASGLYLGGNTSCDHIFLNTNGITCFFNTVCVPSLRVQSAFADLTLCGSNTTSPHLGGTFSITTNQDALGRTIIGNGSVGRAIYLESNGQAIFNCGAKFGNGSGCLNYYEQGTFSPAFGGSTSGCGVPGGTNSALGYYTRIGNQVFITVAVNSSTFPSYSGDLIMWLPFTSCNQGGLASVTYHGPSIYFYPYANWGSNYCINDITPYILGGNGFLGFNIYGTGGDRQAAINSGNTNLSGAAGIYTRFSINYTAV